MFSVIGPRTAHLICLVNDVLVEKLIEENILGFTVGPAFAQHIFHGLPPAIHAKGVVTLAAPQVPQPALRAKRVATSEEVLLTPMYTSCASSLAATDIACRGRSTQQWCVSPTTLAMSKERECGYIHITNSTDNANPCHTYLAPCVLSPESITQSYQLKAKRSTKLGACIKRVILPASQLISNRTGIKDKVQLLH